MNSQRPNPALPRGQHTLGVEAKHRASPMRPQAGSMEGTKKIQSAGSWIGWIAADVGARGIIRPGARAAIRK